jgi:hypothetical protein
MACKPFRISLIFGVNLAWHACKMSSSGPGLETLRLSSGYQFRGLFPAIEIDWRSSAGGVRAEWNPLLFIFILERRF